MDRTTTHPAIFEARKMFYEGLCWYSMRHVRNGLSTKRSQAKHGYPFGPPYVDEVGSKSTWPGGIQTGYLHHLDTLRD